MSSGDATPFRTKKQGPLHLYLWPNNPERVTITTDMGVPEYQVFTGEGHLFGSGPVSSIEKLWDGPDGGFRVGILAKISWRNWEFQPICVFQPAVVRSCMLPEATRVQDFLYKRSAFSTTRYFCFGKDGTEYRWKIMGTRKAADLALSATSDPDRQLAVFKQGYPGKGAFKGERKHVLIIQPYCPLHNDIVVLSFLIMEKKRRDRDGDEFVACPYSTENDWDSGMGAAEAGEGGGGGTG